MDWQIGSKGWLDHWEQWIVGSVDLIDIGWLDQCEQWIF